MALVRTMLTLQPDVAATAVEEQTGRLELDGVLLPGRLVEGPGASGPAWLPRGGESASTFRKGVSGRIVYKETPTTVRAGTTSTTTIVMGQPPMVAFAPAALAGAIAVRRVVAAQPALPAGAVVMERAQVQAARVVAAQPARAVLAEQPAMVAPRIRIAAPRRYPPRWA